MDLQSPTGTGTEAPATGAQPPESPPGSLANPPSGQAQDASAAQESGATQDAGQPAPQAPEPRSSVQRRIDELVRARHEAERVAQAERAQREKLELEQRTSAQLREMEAQEPRPEQFSTLLDYQRAVADWSTRRGLAMFEAKAALQQHETRQADEQQRQQIAQAQVAAMAEQARIKAKLTGGEKKYADFQKVVHNPDLPPMLGTPLLEAVMSADNAADISYSLAKNPGEYVRLLQLSVQNPMLAFKEIAALDGKFSAASKTTGAPPPPPNLGGSSPQGEKPNPNDTEAWMKWRDAELKAQRRRA